MGDGPTIDGRRRDDLRAALETIAPTYTDGWEPGGDDPGDAVVQVFAAMAGDVVERLDRAPAKHRVAFFDTLGFGRRPPQSATVPVAFTVAEGAGENAVIPSGTELSAETDDAELRFRVEAGEGFEATPARLRNVYSVDAATDRLFAHHDAIDGAADATIFAGEDRQENVLYIGHPERLSMSDVSRIRVDVRTDGDPSRLVWEYHGEQAVDEAASDVEPTTADDDGTEGWHELRWNAPFLELDPAGTLTETEVDGVESSWIRCRVPTAETPTGPFDLTFADVSFPGAHNTVAPDRLYANDVPQPTDDGTVYPFGSIPRHRDTFYIACEEAFTKRDAEVTIRFGELAIPDAFDVPDDVVLEEIARTMDVVGQVATAGFDAQVAAGILESRRDPGTPDTGTKIGGSSTADLGDVTRRALTFIEANPELLQDLETSWFDPISDDGPDDDPRLSWEYWDGDAWSVLPITEDQTDALRRRGPLSTLTFDVPDDLDSTTVAGKDGVWIRARLVAGEYVRVRYVEDPDAGEDDAAFVRDVRGEPPRFDAVSIEYAYGDAVRPTHLLPYNNREYGANLADQRGSFRPFEPLPDRTQTVYLGFDGPLRGGPVQLYVDVADRTYPDDFTPRISWEYLSDPATDTWTRLVGRDGTDGLTEPGIVSLAFPEETRPTSRFDHERHWIRARVRGDEFDAAEGVGDNDPADGASDIDAVEGASEIDTSDGPSDIDAAEESGDGHGTTPERGASTSIPATETDLRGVDRCRPVLGTGVPSGLPTTAAPDVGGIYPNTGRVANVSVVEDELLGSGDGSPNASFTVKRPPVVDLEVWVDELSSVSASDREGLRDEAPERVDVQRDRRGDVTAFWVRWTPVADFLGSDRDDREYVVDRVAGEITFGDGTAGRIPPHGRDNVRATYRTGGGSAGNVAPGTITDLVSAIPLVEEVTNPIAGSGGAPPESTDAVLERAPRTLRDRGRAVTAADYERIALDASRRLAEVRCIPGMNRAGVQEPGWVTVVVVPDDRRTTPVPSAELRRQVRRAVGDRAPLSLVANDGLVVRGPSYVSVRVDATVVADEGTRLGPVEDHVDDRLTAFLHPLSGADGDGWAFGELPTISDVYALVEGSEGVDHVSSLQLHYAGDREDVTITDGETPPETAPDTLVRSGTHDLVLEPYEPPCPEDD